MGCSRSRFSVRFSRFFVSGVQVWEGVIHYPGMKKRDAVSMYAEPLPLNKKAKKIGRLLPGAQLDIDGEDDFEVPDPEGGDTPLKEKWSRLSPDRNGVVGWIPSKPVDPKNANARTR